MDEVSVTTLGLLMEKRPRASADIRCDRASANRITVRTEFEKMSMSFFVFEYAKLTTLEG
ncbi:MAG: hypothetical protein BMS9Abin05_2604 [Rhodothermia bacterium]|nr:MAG: hypothetical protein BMS9Abin05_2604 [Rhodothermia bacterium]